MGSAQFMPDRLLAMTSRLLRLQDSPERRSEHCHADHVARARVLEVL
jgi:hypothetical protein